MWKQWIYSRKRERERERGIEYKNKRTIDDKIDLSIQSSQYKFTIMYILRTLVVKDFEPIIFVVLNT